jgi:hypothetical protein
VQRLRIGVRWQVKRDTAFEAVPSFELDFLADPKAVSRQVEAPNLCGRSYGGVRFLGTTPRRPVEHLLPSKC